MEASIVLVVGTLLLLALAAPFVALAALVKVSRLEKRLATLDAWRAAVDRAGVSSPGAGAEPVAPPPAVEPEAVPEPMPTVSVPRPEPSPQLRSTPTPPDAPIAPPAPALAASGAPPESTTGTTPHTPAGAPPASGPRAHLTAADFATNIGPRILVAAGGLAVVVFLALFVRYAWENDWVGPAGRVLSGAVFSLGLVAAGLRLIRGTYRPLGQGLAAAGFAGLYITAYAAHGIYGLVPRSLSATVMVAATLCAVAVADRLGTRLLAALAWTGGYLTPVLMSTGVDRAEGLFAYLLLLGAGAVWLDRRKPWFETLPLALVGTLLLYGGWYAAHFRPERFTVAAVGLVSLSALFVLGTRGLRARDVGLAVAALLAGAAASIGLAHDADRPMSLLLLLLAQAGLAVLLRRRWAWAEAAGAALGALAVLSWFDRWFRPDRGSDALALGLVLAGAYVAALAVRGLLRAQPLRAPDGVTQVVAAGLAWLLLDRVLGVTQPQWLGASAVALATLHLGLGLVARRQDPPQLLWARVTLALAAVFLTLAIPVQLGLFGITLAWAGEALVLLWVGMRHDSRLARAGGYGVLALAVARLLVRHLPLHSGPFTPVVNPAFGTWLLVIAAVAVAWRVTSPARQRGSLLDRAAGLVLAPLGLSLLLGLFSAETSAVFTERARQARAAGNPEGAVLARRQAGLALSVLWTVFATGLLGTGLALRSRGLFYTAYGLFAVTAFKVVMIDLATMGTLYRMLSFLALGVLLLAGAWLNLRFRERLVTPGRRA